MHTSARQALGAPAVFVGRAEEVRRLGGMLRRVRTGLVYGLPGVGKSALAAAVAARYRGPVVHRRIRPGDTLDTVVDDVRRLLREAPVAQALSDASRLEDLARELEARRALCVLDDLHGLRPEERAALVEELGARLRQGALLATSREAVPRHAASPDRFELRLDGLPEAAARSLWEQLDTLYGRREGFGAAWARSRGLPFLLRRAHAGDADGEEPVRAALEALPADERRLAAVLALSEAPLPARALQSVLPGGEAGEALRRLTARLLVETDAQGRHGVHDLVREALGALLSPDEARSAHEALLELLSREPLPAVVRVRAVCRHLQALGRHPERAAFIIDQAEPLVRHGAAAELLSLLGSLPPGLRTAEVRLARARALVRLLDLRRALAELQELRAALEASPPDGDAGDTLQQEAGTVLVRVALFSLELDTCERTLGAMPMPRHPEVFLQQLLAWAALRFFQGRLDESLDMLDTAAGASEDARVLGWCAYARVLMLWIEGRDSELAEPLARCVALLEGAPLDSRGPMVTALSAGILSRLGRFTEAEAALVSARERLERLGAPRLALELDCIAAWTLGERGGRRAALAALRETEARAEHAGYLFVRHLSRVGAGRMLLELGRRAEGLALLDAVEADARARGARGLAGAAEVARASDVRRQVERPSGVEPREVRPGVAARQRALAALHAAGQGDSVRATGLLASLEPLARTEDFALERALGHVARSLLHGRAGRAGEAQAELEAAARAAAEGEVDPELIPELVRALTAPGATPAADEARAGAPDGVVLDARQHELRAAGRTVSLAKRVLPRRLLYALARQPGRTLPKEACVRAMWDADYDPRLHDNALRVHVSYVRELLEGTGSRVVFEDPGYRLEVSEGFAFLPGEPGAT